MAKLASSSTFALDFLRRLLCAHTADDRPGAAAAASHTCTPETEEPPRSPCIVARLMGLDALPPEAPPPHAQLQSQAQRTPPLRRSRSASSAEGSPGPWEWDRDRDTQPRVVRASASLRERPAYLRQESDEFLLLSFSPEDQDPDPERERDVREELDFLLLAAAEATRRGGSVTTSDAAAWSKHRRNGRCRRLRFADDEAESAARVLVLRRRTPAAECDAHNSSPVSVLEAHDESSTTTTSSSLEEVEHAEPCSATSGSSCSLPQFHIRIAVPLQQPGELQKMIRNSHENCGSSLAICQVFSIKVYQREKKTTSSQNLSSFTTICQACTLNFVDNNYHMHGFFFGVVF